MTLHEKLGLIACAGHLALAILLVLGRARSSIALPLALLCVDLFVWNFAGLAWDLTGNRTWRHLDTGASWLTPPLALHIVFQTYSPPPIIRHTLFIHTLHTAP